MSLKYELSSKSLHISAKQLHGTTNPRVPIKSTIFNFRFLGGNTRILAVLKPFLGGRAASAKSPRTAWYTSASERRENTLKDHLKDGSRQGQDMVLTVLHVPSPLDSGSRRRRRAASANSPGRRGTTNPHAPLKSTIFNFGFLEETRRIPTVLEPFFGQSRLRALTRDGIVRRLAISD